MASKTHSSSGWSYASASVLLASCALLVWCSCDSGGDGDGGPADTGPTQDAGHDAGRLDAGDAGPPPPAEWRRVEGLPDDCQIELAVDPNAALGRLGFEDCPGAPAGCRQVVVDWPTHPTLAHFSMHHKPYTGPRETVFTYGRASDEGPVERFYYVAATLAGDHLVAARSVAPDFSRDSWCSIGELLVDRDEATFLVVRNPEGPRGRQKFLGRVSYAAPATVRPLWRGPDEPTTTTTYQKAHVGAGIVAYEAGPPIEVYRIDREGNLDRVAAPGRGVPFNQLSDVVDGSILVSRLDDEVTNEWWIAIAREEDASVSPFIGGPGDGSYAGPVSDGVDLVWSRGIGPTAFAEIWSRYELWTSPWSDDPSRLVPRQLADMELTSIAATLGVGHGRAWAFEAPATGGGVVIFDLRGGQHRRFANDDPDFMTMTPILGAEEIAFPMERREGLRESRTVTLRIMRYDSLPVYEP